MSVTRPHRNEGGFSLIEVMVATVIAAIAVLAISQGTISSLNNNSLARERIAATNLALDVIESWQASASDALPSLECSNGTVLLVTGTATGTQASCVLFSQEVKTSFTITISTSSVQAPLPPNPATNTLAMADLYAGLRITALLVDRNDANIIYAGTHGDGLYKSSDAGSTWNKVNGSGYTNVNALVQMPGTGHVFMAATDSYTIANTNWGGSWQQLKGTVPNALHNNNVLSLATDPYGILYAGSDNYTVLNDGGIYKSTDTGVTWNSTNAVDTYSLYNPYSTSYVPGGGTYDNYTVYAIAYDTYVYAGTRGGLFYSTDDGANWYTPTIPPGGGDVYALATTSSGTVYAATGNGVYVSTDRGDSWSNINIANEKFRTLAVDSGNNLYAGSDSGTYLYTGSTTPASTTGLNYMANVRTYSLATPSTSNSTVVYAGSDGGLFKSTNSGSNWSRSDSGIGLIPKEKVVEISWKHKGKTYHVTLTHITERPY